MRNVEPDEGDQKREETETSKPLVSRRENGIPIEVAVVVTDRRIEDPEGETNTDKGHEDEDPVTFESLLEYCGSEGKWNVLMFFLCSFFGIVSPLHVFSYQFLGATPDHWCHVEELYKANWTDEQILSLAIPFENKSEKYDGCQAYDLNYTDAAQLGYEVAIANKQSLVIQTSDSNSTLLRPCSYGRSFNLSQYSSTVVTEWDLVCERRPLYSTTFAIVQVGDLVAYFVAGFLLDAFGRRPVVLATSVLYMLTGFVACLSPSVEVYIFLKGVISFMDSSFYLGTFIIVMEITTTKYRSLVGTLYAIPYAIGYAILPGIAYGIRTWKFLQAALTIPSLLSFIYFIYLPESPRWLILNGRYEEALAVFRWAAKVNKKALPKTELMIQTMEKIKNSSQASEDDIDNPCTKATCLSQIMGILKQMIKLFGNAELRRRLLVVYYCWFSGSMVYFGVALMSINLSTDPYLHIFFGGLLEIPSYLMLWFCIARIGRRISYTLLFLIGALCISLITATMILNSSETSMVAVVLSQAGKFFITAAFQLSWIYTAELFPTKYRSIAIGQASVCARIGSICSPYINDIMGDVIVWAPSAIFAGTSLLAAILAMTLPETKDKDLQETNKYSKKKSEPKAVLIVDGI